MKSKIMLIGQILLAAVIVVTVAACSSVPKAALSSESPQEALTEVTGTRDRLLSQQVDLIQPGLFTDGDEKLHESKEAYKDKEEVSEIMTLAAEAKGLYQEAERKAESKKNVPDRLLSSREGVLKTNIRNNAKLSEELSEVDSELYDATDEFSQKLPDNKFGTFQKKYLTLEVKSVQHNELSLARKVIRRAESNDADDKAKTTFSDAKKNVAAAENMIETNVREPNEYNQSVAVANRSAKLLDDVMNKIGEMGNDTSEKVALKLVLQDRKIGKLTDNIDDLEHNLDKKQVQTSNMKVKMFNQEQMLTQSSRKVAFQNAMDEMRKNFSKDEAEVYQQGEKLIIRLKKINFATSSAKLPEKSIDLLSKVKEIVASMPAKSVVVQGHTDATGPNDFNKQLSVARAKSVAKYLRHTTSGAGISSEGYGEMKPLASNNTKKGRSLNRRVDIVITSQ